MAYATVVLDGIYSKNEVEELTKNIDYRTGWFKWDDALNAEVTETFSIDVKYKSSDGKYLYYFAKDPSIDKVTVAIIRGYNPVAGGLWGQELNDEAKREFFNQLNNIDNIVLVVEKLTRNKSEILDKLNSKDLLIKKQIYVPPPAPKPTPTPAPTPTPEPTTSTDIGSMLSNPTTLMLIGGVLLILILIMKK
ncbi:MAG: hypothetical protein JG759_398 [Thermoanaerobacter sp.]|nr:hypothetical protein [Thermoanaerobacter sp.]